MQRQVSEEFDQISEVKIKFIIRNVDEVNL